MKTDKKRERRLSATELVEIAMRGRIAQMTNEHAAIQAQCEFAIANSTDRNLKLFAEIILRIIGVAK
jgi:hypothetical protein